VAGFACKDYCVSIRTNNSSCRRKKWFLIEVLDKNMLYVPYWDMKSKEFEITEAYKAAIRAFYNLKNG